jgi:MFS-type transporter involved in bile tolerance (Atg22 family)
LAHDLPEVHDAKERYHNGTITEEEFAQVASIQRSRIMNLSYLANNAGFVICCGLSLGALFGVRANDSVENNNWGYSVSVAVCTGFWIIFAIPWFLWEKKRPGPPLPKGDNYLTFGAKQFWFALKQVWTLKQTFFYLIAFFLLADGVATQLTLISIAQTQAVAFSATYNTYFLIVQGSMAGAGCWVCYQLQKRFNLRTKIILQVVNFCCLLTAIWGMIGIWTTKIGFHNQWEFWLFAATYGFTFGPQFSYGQAMMAELVPHGREYLFFSLLGIVSKGSAWIGPIICSAIVDRSGNQWTAFAFVAALIFVPFVGIFFISEEKSRVECQEYLAREATKLRKLSTEGDEDSESRIRQYSEKSM